MTKGKLIVIEGTDGSGKATQTKELLTRLKKERFSSATMSFPHYKGNVFGELIGECLAGGRGDYLSLDPRITSSLYAGDRFESKDELNNLLGTHDVVVLDRYVSSNQIHQGGRIPKSDERKKFFVWLDNLEHNLFGLPRPDVVIFLDVLIDISMKLAKNAANDPKKDYLKGGKDVYERDISYNLSSRENALMLLEQYPNWIKIECTEDKELLPIQTIHEKIWEKVRAVL